MPVLHLSCGAGLYSFLLPLAGLALGGRRRRRGNETDEKTQEAYHILVDSTFDGIMILSPEGHVTWTDANFLDLTGYAEDEILNQHFTSIIDPGDAEKVQQYLTQVTDEAQTFTVRAIDREGSVQVYQISAVGSEGEEALEIVAGVRDITEEESVRRRIAFTEKMDLLSRVMNTIGRDLGPIIATLSPLVEMGEDPQVEQMLRNLSDLEKRVELFPRRGIRDGAEIGLHDLLDEVVDEVRKERDFVDTELSLKIDDELYPVFGDAGQLTEALRNVLTNAFQAAGENQGEVTVRCNNHTVERAAPRKGYILPTGEYTHITIADTGSGMPAEILDHVFEPLFTTHPGGALAGLGLAVTYTVVKNHRGYIDIESSLGEGTRVDMFLPRSRISPARPEAAPAAAEETAQKAAPAVTAEPAEAAAEKDVGETADREPAVEVEPATEAEPAVEVEAEAEVGMEAAGETATEAEQEAEVEPTVEAEVTAETEEAAETEPVEEPEPEEELDQAEIATLSGHETILIIEEDGESRSQIEEILEHFGYSALPARNWVEGVDLFKRHGNIIDLVLLNVEVPEMVWVKTLMDLRRADTDARVGLIGSGEVSDTMKRYLDMPGISFLNKPVRTAGLMRGVRSSLDANVK